jgi:hypothetical protein
VSGRADAVVGVSRILLSDLILARQAILLRYDFGVVYEIKPTKRSFRELLPPVDKVEFDSIKSLSSDDQSIC